MQLDEIGYKFDTNGQNRLQIQNFKVTNGRNSLQIVKKEMDEIGYKPTKSNQTKISICRSARLRSLALKKIGKY